VMTSQKPSLTRFASNCRDSKSESSSDSNSDSDWVEHNQPSVTKKATSSSAKGRAGAINITPTQWAVIVSTSKPYCLFMR
jgi:hypothetical protein